MAITFASRRPEYEALWASASVRPENASEVKATARRIISNRPRYDGVSRETGVPWYVIGLIHAMECGFSFEKHLHNGDPLRRRTVQVPKGRPTTHDGPFTWEESAIDALRYDKLDKVRDWSIPRIAFCLETFNGFGYVAKGVHSPYLWSFTTAYERGKFIADGKWSSVAVSKQCGAMAVLKALIELEPTQVDLNDDAKADRNWVKAAPPAAPSAPVVAVQSTTNRSIVGAGLGSLALFFKDAVEWVSGLVGSGVEVLESSVRDVEGGLDPIISLGKLLQVNMTGIIATVTVGLLGVALVRHTMDKRKLVVMKQVLPEDEGGK